VERRELVGVGVGSPVEVVVVVVEAEARFREERTVTVGGSVVGKLFRSPLFRTEAPSRGDMLFVAGPGSLDRAVCTRSSSFCILPIKPRIWYSDLDEVVALGMLELEPETVRSLPATLRRGTPPTRGVAAGLRAGVVVDNCIDGPLECSDVETGGRMPDRRGVVVGRPARILEGTGVNGAAGFLLVTALLGSDFGGEEGDVSSVEVSDFVGGGVVINGEDIVVAVPVSAVMADPSDAGVGGLRASMSIAMGLGFRFALSLSIVDSACLSFP
jgi:hypothetical protein